jgi:hypothetical protein
VVACAALVDNQSHLIAVCLIHFLEDLTEGLSVCFLILQYYLEMLLIDYDTDSTNIIAHTEIFLDVFVEPIDLFFNRL